MMEEHRLIKVVIPTDTPEIKYRKMVAEKGDDKDRRKANRAFGVAVGGGALYSLSEFLKKTVPPTNPQPATLKHQLIPLGMAAAVYATGIGAGHAIVNAEEPKEVAKGVGLATGATGLGVALYQANKSFIESGRYPKTTWPKLSLLGTAGVVAAPFAAYQLYKLKDKVVGENTSLTDFIRQRVRDY